MGSDRWRDEVRQELRNGGTWHGLLVGGGLAKEEEGMRILRKRILDWVPQGLATARSDEERDARVRLTVERIIAAYETAARLYAGDAIELEDSSGEPPKAVTLDGLLREVRLDPSLSGQLREDLRKDAIRLLPFEDTDSLLPHRKWVGFLAERTLAAGRWIKEVDLHLQAELHERALAAALETLTHPDDELASAAVERVFKRWREGARLTNPQPLTGSRPTTEAPNLILEDVRREVQWFEALFESVSGEEIPSYFEAEATSSPEPRLTRGCRHLRSKTTNSALIPIVLDAVFHKLRKRGPCYADGHRIPREKWSAFVFTSLDRRLKDEFERLKNQRHSQNGDEHDELDDLVSKELSPDDAVIAKDLIERALSALPEALKELSFADRQILDFYYREQLTRSAIAKRLGRTEGAVERRRSRAKKRLQDEWGIVFTSAELRRALENLDSPSEGPGTTHPSSSP